MADDNLPAVDVSHVHVEVGGGRIGPLPNDAVIYFSTKAITVFLGSDIAAAVVGNAAHGALKEALGGMPGSRFLGLPDPWTGKPDPGIVLFARILLNTRCAELGLGELVGPAFDLYGPSRGRRLEIAFPHPWGPVTAILHFSKLNPGSVRVKVTVPLEQLEFLRKAEKQDNTPGRGLPAGTGEWVFWLGSVVSSGVLGNAAYAAVKAAVRALIRVLRRPKRGPALKTTEAIAFATEAARLKLRRTSADADADDSIEVTHVDRTTDGWEVRLLSAPDRLLVRLPSHRDLNGIVEARVRRTGGGRDHPDRLGRGSG